MPGSDLEPNGLLQARSVDRAQLEVGIDPGNLWLKVISGG
jgi:hypothetical protein